MWALEVLCRWHISHWFWTHPSSATCQQWNQPSPVGGGKGGHWQRSLYTCDLQQYTAPPGSQTGIWRCGNRQTCSQEWRETDSQLVLELGNGLNHHTLSWGILHQLKVSRWTVPLGMVQMKHTRLFRLQNSQSPRWDQKPVQSKDLSGGRSNPSREWWCYCRPIEGGSHIQEESICATEWTGLWKHWEAECQR